MTQIEAIAAFMGWRFDLLISAWFDKHRPVVMAFRPERTEAYLTPYGEKALRDKLLGDGYTICQNASHIWLERLNPYSASENEKDLPTAFCKAYGLDYEVSE